MVARSEGAIALIQTMLALRAEHRTGVLNVRSEAVRTLIHFREGSIVSAEDEEAPSPSDNLEERARSAIVRALKRDGLSSAFDDLPERPRPAAPVALDMESIVLEVMCAIPRERNSEVVLAGKSAQLVVVSGNPKELGARFGMTASELAFLERIDGSRTVGDLLGVASHEVDVCGLLAALVLFESVVLSPSVNAGRARSDAEQALLDGQTALSAGDDETAKKCFYEVLRLDPESPAATDAKHHVRLLARRGTTPPPHDAVVEAVPRVEETVEAVVPAAVAPPVERADVFFERERVTEPARRAEVAPPSRRTPPPLPRRKSTPATVDTARPTRAPRTKLVAAVIVLGGAAAIFATSQSAPTSVTAAPTPSLTHPPSLARVATVAPTPPVVPVKPIASAETPVETPLETDAGRTGTVQLPAYAKDRRVYVDGRLEQDGAATLVLSCGPHAIQIGSHGTPKSIAVLCGREIRLE